MKEKYHNINWKYLSEENTKINLINNLEIDSEWLWILDPLDGTKDFLSKSVCEWFHKGFLK